MTLAQNTAHDLLSIGAVFLRPDDPFTWASGVKSPIYCDNRLVLSAPQARKRVEEGIASTIRESFPRAEMLMGTATAGIAHAAIAACILDLPMGYVRSSAKDHGRQNKIEGRMAPGTRVVVVEDLVSTAVSSLETVQALRDAGAEVLGIVSIFTYGTARAKAALEAAGCTNHSLSDLDTLLEVAVEENYISQEQRQSILTFRDTI